MTNRFFKEFIDIMSEIDAAIVHDPIARQKYIHYLDDEIQKLEKELAQEEKPEVKYLEFDKNGRLVRFLINGHAKDFRKR